MFQQMTTYKTTNLQFGEIVSAQLMKDGKKEIHVHEKRLCP